MGIGPGKRCMDMVSSACLTIAKRDFTIGTPDGLQERRPGSAKFSHPIIASVFIRFHMVSDFSASVGFSWPS